MMNYSKLIILLSIVVFLFSCEKETYEIQSGDIFGYVDIYDEYGNLVEDESGATVSLDDSEYTSRTNEIGKYEFSEIQSGIYKMDVTYEKSFLYRTSLTHLGGNIAHFIEPIEIHQQTTRTIEELNVYYNPEDGNIGFNGNCSRGGTYSIEAFLMDTPDVSFYNNTTYSGDFILHIGITHINSSETDTGFRFGIELSNTPFNEGEQVYAVLYFKNYYDGGYYDQDYGLTVYTSYKQATDVISLTLE